MRINAFLERLNSAGYPRTFWEEELPFCPTVTGSYNPMKECIFTINLPALSDVRFAAQKLDNETRFRIYNVHPILSAPGELHFILKIGLDGNQLDPSRYFLVQSSRYPICKITLSVTFLTTGMTKDVWEGYIVSFGCRLPHQENQCTTRRCTGNLLTCRHIRRLHSYIII